MQADTERRSESASLSVKSAGLSGDMTRVRDIKTRSVVHNLKEDSTSTQERVNSRMRITSTGVPVAAHTRGTEGRSVKPDRVE